MYYKIVVFQNVLILMSKYKKIFQLLTMLLSTWRSIDCNVQEVIAMADIMLFSVSHSSY